MRAVIQRIRRGSVTVNGNVVASKISLGLMIFLGIGHEDSEEKAQAMAKKIALLRIFEDELGKMNLSILDVAGEAIVVSQFTLYADTRKGNRPSFIQAAAPDKAEALVNYFADQLRLLGINTQQGEFGAHMMVDILNDGPVTITLEY
ncbi:MAG: D-aminoacyl-tRNA deacylase [Anaerolineaceae bacterium]|jgi:D-tyrosyl-tRNA(Tyr) deacylase